MKSFITLLLTGLVLGYTEENIDFADIKIAKA